MSTVPKGEILDYEKASGNGTPDNGKPVMRTEINQRSLNIRPVYCVCACFFPGNMVELALRRFVIYQRQARKNTPAKL
jgi:hypothetical protein